VDDVPRDQQGNAKAAFLYRDALQFVDGGDIHLIDYGADSSISQQLAKALRRMSIIRIDLGHLADLLIQGHLREEIGDSAGDGRSLVCRIGDKAVHDDEQPARGMW
jgi:hypothetical protein